MDVKHVILAEASGHILLHHQADATGRKVLTKGRIITTDDITILEQLGISRLYVGELASDDVLEDDAATRLGAVIGAGAIRLTRASSGRINWVAEGAGLLKINVPALHALNDLEGFALATLPNHRVVQPRQVLATLKIIPYAVPEIQLQRAEQLAQAAFPLMEIKPFVVPTVTLLMTGSQAGEAKVRQDFIAPVEQRLAMYQAALNVGAYLPDDEVVIRAALRATLSQGAKLILMVGETSIMDPDDIIPRALKSIGGEVMQHGVPVEPGNLLMLGYHENVPILVAPGCARSLSYNVIDMILPRLLAGEYLTRRDLTELGHGGYLRS